MICTMHVWGWFISIYLFLGGIGAGAYLTSAAAEKGLFGHVPHLQRLGYIISAPVAGTGAGLLLLDLGQGLHKPWLLIGLVTNPHSVMSWGTGILSGFICLGLIRGGMALLRKPAPTLLTNAGAVLAVATAGYTGMLLAAVKAIPLWHSLIIPVLFTISALSSGMSATTLLSHCIEDNHPEPKRVCLAHVILVIAELLVLAILFYIINSGRMGPIAAKSGTMIMFDRFSTVFWLVLVGLGLVVPLIFYIYHYVYHRVNFPQAITLDDSVHGLPMETVGNPESVANSGKAQGALKFLSLCDLAVLIGGLSLRCLIIFGALPVWSGVLS